VKLQIKYTVDHLLLAGAIGFCLGFAAAVVVVLLDIAGAPCT
jgi:hypothetical protein